jgi:hypothetical protein
MRKFQFVKKLSALSLFFTLSMSPSALASAPIFSPEIQKVVDAFSLPSDASQGRPPSKKTNKERRAALLSLYGILKTAREQTLKKGIQESQVEQTQNDFQLFHAFQMVELKELQSAKDCEEAGKTLRALEGKNVEGTEPQFPAHQTLLRLVQPLCAPTL